MNQLAKLSQAAQLLAEAKTLSEVQNVKDLAEAARQYAKALDLGTESLNYATEIKLRAERRLGEMLTQAERGKAGRPSKEIAARVSAISQSAETPPIVYGPAIKELGITDRTARRWQTEAKVPERQFNDWITEKHDTGEEFTPTDFRRFAQQLEGGSATKPVTETLIICPNCEHAFNPAKAEKRRRKPDTDEPKYPQNKVRKIAELAYREVRKTELPTNAKAQGKLWWTPLMSLSRMAGWSPIRVTVLIWATDQRMRRDNLTVTDPNSMVKVANSVLDDFRNGRKASTDIITRAEAFVAKHLRGPI